MLSLRNIEARMTARRLLAAEYRRDVKALAEKVLARAASAWLGGGEVPYELIEEALHEAVRTHPRVQDEMLALETIACSGNRDAIQEDYIPGWSVEFDGPWLEYIGPIDPMTGEQHYVILPPWASIAFFALYRDVMERIEEIGRGG